MFGKLHSFSLPVLNLTKLYNVFRQLSSGYDNSSVHLGDSLAQELIL